MNRFMYFISGVSGCNAAALALRGLLSRFSDRGTLLEHQVVEWRDGPGGNGCCVALGREIPEYLPDAQVWTNCGSYALCMARDMQPGPSDLERPVGFAGHSITLLDGKEWRVPMLRQWDGVKCEFVSSLPKALRPAPDAAGVVSLRQCVIASCQPLDALGAEIQSAFCAQAQWTVERMFAAVASVLSENYRIGADEIAHLGLIDQALGLRVLGLSVDEPTVAEHAAMSAAAGLHFTEVPRG